MTRTALVTGAARGIGRAIAGRLGSDGYRLVLVDISSDLEPTALDLQRSGLDVVTVEADLSTDDGIGAAASATETIDLLVNNAGITRDARLVNMSEEDFRAVLTVNLGAAYRLSRAIAPRLRAGGAIVNVASRSYLGNFGQFNYSMSKGGVVGLTRSLALQLAPDIRVNAVAPGLIATEMTMAIPEKVRTEMVEAIPLGRMGEPAEVGDLVSFLGSERASYITGQVIVIGGGRSLS